MVAKYNFHFDNGMKYASELYFGLTLNIIYCNTEPIRKLIFKERWLLIRKFIWFICLLVVFALRFLELCCVLRQRLLWGWAKF